MKRYILFFMLIVIGCTSETKVYSESEVEKKNNLWYEKKSKELVSGIIEIRRLRYISESMYKDGKRNGLTIFYDKLKEHITRKTTFINGLEEGVSFVYFPNSEMIQMKIMYKNGKSEGETIFYTIDGRKILKLQYKNGLEYGKAKFYNKGES